MNWSAILYRAFAEHFGSIVFIAFVLAILTAVWVTKTNSDRKNFKEFMAEVKQDIKRIFERLPPPKTAESVSPLRLTDFGREISNLINANEWADKLANELIEKHRNKEDFEIHHISEGIVYEKIETDEETSRMVKKASYEKGTTIDNVRIVLVIELRDALLKMINEQSSPSP